MHVPVESEKEALIIIPTYNEKDNIALLIKTIFANCPFIHILVVDDNSPDGTSQTVETLQSHYPNKIHLKNRPKKQGLGTAYIEGFEFALAQGYSYILTMDADFSHPPDKIIALYLVCKEQGYDAAIGSRYIQGIKVANWPLSRTILSYGANLLTRLMTGMSIKDLTAGFQCYKSEVIRTIDIKNIKSIGYSFQVETKFLAWKYQFRIKEIPILFTNRVRGYSKMSHTIIVEAFFRIITLKATSLFKNFKRPPLPSSASTESPPTRNRIV